MANYFRQNSAVGTKNSEIFRQKQSLIVVLSSAGIVVVKRAQVSTSSTIQYDCGSHFYRGTRRTHRVSREIIFVHKL